MPEPKQYTDTELTGLVAGGDQRAFTVLMKRYWEVTYQFLAPYLNDRQLSQEIVQDIFLQMWLKRLSLQDIKDFKSYLFVAARNRALNAIRNNTREKRHRLLWLTNQLNETSVEEPSTEVELAKVDAAILRLPAQQRQVWIMSRKHGKKYREIAEALNISANAVKRYVQLANASIARQLHSPVDLIIIVALLFLMA